MEEGGLFEPQNWQGKTKEQISSSYKIVVWSLIIALCSFVVALVATAA